MNPILADHHEKNQGAGISQIQLLGLLAANGIGKDRGRTILTAGVKSKIWRTETGSRNAVLYLLNGWEPEEPEVI